MIHEYCIVATAGVCFSADIRSSIMWWKVLPPDSTAPSEGRWSFLSVRHLRRPQNGVVPRIFPRLVSHYICVVCVRLNTEYDARH